MREWAMLIHQTMEKLAQMKLQGFLDGLREQLESPRYGDLSFEERLGLIVDREYLLRENRRLTRRLQETRLKNKAELEDVDFQARRGLEKNFLLELAGCTWIAQHHNLIITGPTGVGKSFLTCALAHRACKEGWRIIYYRFSDFLRELAMSLADGSYPKLAAKIAKRDLLVVDDWLRDPVGAEPARQLLDLLDDRFRNKSTLLTSQVPIAAWHERFKDPTLADALLDRIVHDAHRLELKGDSMRKRTSSLT
jgi:DNA replication protein DnaC